MLKLILTDFWLQHQASLVVFLAVIIAIAIVNVFALRRFKLGRYQFPKILPKVSVMVPTRNEEKNIGQCIESLLAQDYPDFEVIALDDQSTDRTWEILQKFRTVPRLILMQGKKLPDRWFGKHWACHQMTEAASGEIFLFTDADTKHKPDSISSAVAALIAENADLLTALPREETGSFGEAMLIPVMPFAILGFLSIPFAHAVKWPIFSATVGQFMMFKRKAFEAIGGYPAIKTKQVDDMAFGQRIKKLGYRWRFFDGQSSVVCRMYGGFKESFLGLGKTVFSAFGRRIIPFLFVWTFLFTVFLEPFAVIAVRLSGGPITDLSLLIALSGILASMLLWTITILKFRFPFWTVFLYPATFALTLIMAYYSVIITLSGKATWKGRRL
ncbi:glycosyltransferase [bacterium]|nr:glycosyltransferase [bacterium]